MKGLKLFGVLITSFMLIGLNVKAENDPIAKIGNTTYDTLQEAVDDAPNGVETSIEILRSGENIPGFKLQSGKNIIIDFNDYTIQLGEPLVGSTGTVSQNFQLLKDSTVVLKNGTLKAAPSARRLIQNYANLTLQDMTLDGTTMAETVEYAVSFSNGKVNILGETNIYAHQIAFDVYYWPKSTSTNLDAYPNGTQVYVNTTGTIKGMIEVSGTTNVNPTSTLKIENINHEGELSIDEGFENQITILGGTYTTNISDLITNVDNQKIIVEDNKYTVYSKHEVLVGDIGDNGNITFDKEKAYYGETITMTITPDEGYEIDNISVIDDYNNAILVENNKFVMPNTDAWIGVYFKPIQKVIEPVVSEKITVAIQNTTDTQDVLLESLSKFEEFKNKNVNVQVVVEDIKATEDITKEFTKTLEKNKVNNGKILSYFDISIAVNDAKTNEKLGNLTELTEKIQFAIAIPANVENVKDGYTRNYYIIKKHDDKVSVINGTLSKDGKSIIFETNEFSTYALAYEDKVINNVDNPKTFDGINATLIFGSLALISITGITLYFKKELENK